MAPSLPQGRAGVPLRDALGLTLRELRRVPPCRELARREWSVFVAVACHWRGHAHAWPSHATIAAFAGYTARVVPAAVAALETRGLLSVRRRLGTDGLRRMAYAPGLALLRALEELASGVPELAAEPAELPADATELASVALERASGIDRNGLPLNKPRRRTGDLVVVDPPDDAREIALDALAAYFRRRHPGMAPVRTFDAQDVDAVARCAGSVTGDREAKLRALLDSVEGAFLASPRPPTVRFVWGRIEHFLVHAERGRRLRLRREHDASDAKRSAHATSTAHAAAAPDARSQGGIPREQLQADLVRLFGPTWRSAR